MFEYKAQLLRIVDGDTLVVTIDLGMRQVFTRLSYSSKYAILGGMLTLNYRYRIYPDAAQQVTLFEWMETCRTAYNYGLREIKDWCNSRKCLIDRCSIEQEYVLPADLKFPNEVQQLNALPHAKKEFPRLGEVPSQVLQQVIKQLHKAWEGFQTRKFGFPRFN